MEERAGERTVDRGARGACFCNCAAPACAISPSCAPSRPTPRELFAPHRFRDLAARNMCAADRLRPDHAGAGRSRAPARGAARRAASSRAGGGDGLRLWRGGAVAAGARGGDDRAVRDAGDRGAATARRARLANVETCFGDGLAPDATLGFFDRIVLHMSFQRRRRSRLSPRSRRTASAVFGRFEPDRPRTTLVRAGAAASDAPRAARCGARPISAPAGSARRSQGAPTLCERKCVHLR